MRAFTVTIACFLSMSVFAQPANWRSMTQEQLSALPDQQLALLPMFEFFERIDQKTNLSQYEPHLASMFTRLFYAMDRPVYPFGPYLEAAVREFQSDIGAKIDGILKLGEFEQVRTRFEALNQAAYPIFPQYKQRLFIMDGYVSFGGTWMIEGGKHSYPINYTSYSCHRDRMLCYTAEGYISSGTSQGSLQVNAESQKIIKWDATEILMEDHGQCRVSTISVNLKSNDVIMITRDRGGACDTLPKLGTPRISRLVDGFTSMLAANHAQREISDKGLSRRMQGILQGLKQQ